MELEEQVMGIIINAGQSRSLCYEALHAAKAGDFATADAKMQEAAHYSREAHLVQTQLIEADEGEGKTKNDAGDGPCSGSPDDLHSGERADCRTDSDLPRATASRLAPCPARRAGRV